MGYGLGYCCCGGSSVTCSNASIPAQWAFHSGVYFGMQQMYLSFYVSNADAPAPWNTLAFPLHRMLLLTTDGVTFTRPATGDGFNVQVVLEADAPTVPNPAVPYQTIKKIHSVTLTNGADVVALVRNPSTELLEHDLGLTTVNVCFGQLDAQTLIVPRIYPTNTNVKLTAAFSGFGGRPSCAAMNETRKFFDANMPTGGTAITAIDGYEVPDTWTSNVANPVGGGVTIAGISRVKFYSFVTQRWSSVSGSFTSAITWQDQFRAPAETTINYTASGYSNAHPLMGYLQNEINVGLPANSAFASEGLAASRGRLSTDLLSPLDFTLLTNGASPTPVCPLRANVGSLTEVISP